MPSLARRPNSNDAVILAVDLQVLSTSEPFTRIWKISTGNFIWRLLGLSSMLMEGGAGASRTGCSLYLMKEGSWSWSASTSTPRTHGGRLGIYISLYYKRFFQPRFGLSKCAK